MYPMKPNDHNKKIQNTTQQICKYNHRFAGRMSNYCGFIPSVTGHKICHSLLLLPKQQPQPQPAPLPPPSSS